MGTRKAAWQGSAAGRARRAERGGRRASMFSNVRRGERLDGKHPLREREAAGRSAAGLVRIDGCRVGLHDKVSRGRDGRAQRGGATRRSAAVEEARMLRCRPVPNPPFPTPESRPSRGAARAHSSSSRLTAGQNARPGASGAVLWPAGPVEPSHVARSAQPDATAARPRAARCRAALLLARRLSRPGPRQRCRPGHARVRLRQRREAADARGGMRCERPRARGGAEINARGEVGRTSAGSTQAASSMSN